MTEARRAVAAMLEVEKEVAELMLEVVRVKARLAALENERKM